MRRLETREWWPELVRVRDEHTLHELAERFGASPGAISSALRRAGFSRKRGTRKARAADGAAPTNGSPTLSERSLTRSAWRVIFADETTRVGIGTSLLEVARAAERLGPVVKVERIGEALDPGRQ